MKDIGEVLPILNVMTVVFTSDSGLPEWVARARQGERRDPAADRLRRAAVNAGTILPPAVRDPRTGESPGKAQADHANTGQAPVTMPTCKPNPPRPQGRLALHPLDQFGWGTVLRSSGRGMVRMAAPRVTPDHLLIVPTSGSLRLELPRLAHLLHPGSVTFVPTGTAFSLLHLGVVQGLALAIPAPVVQRAGTILPDNLTSGRPGDADAAAVVSCARQLGQMDWAQGRAAIAPVAQPLNRLALILSRLQDCPAETAGPGGHGQPTRLLAERFLRLVQREMGHHLTIADFAQELGVSTAALDRACQFARGRGALDLFHDLQLERAVRLLREGDNDMTGIARSLGYAGPAHMKRAFIAATGRPPEAFLPR